MLEIFVCANFLSFGVLIYPWKAVKEKVKEKEEPTEKPGQTECKVVIIVIMVFSRHICRLRF